MNVNRYIYFLLQTPIGTISLDDELYLRYILRVTLLLILCIVRCSNFMIQKNYLTILFPLPWIMMMMFSQFFEILSYYTSAYININKRFRKLYQLGFLEKEKVPGEFLHGARNYMISEKGFVFLFAHNVHFDFHKYFE